MIAAGIVVGVAGGADVGGGRGRVAVLVAVEGATVAANVGVGEGDFCGAGVLGALSGVAEARVDVAVARGSGDGRVVALAIGVKEGEETTGGGGGAVGCPCLLCHNVFASNPKITQPARMPELNKTVSRVVSRNLRASFIENPPTTAKTHTNTSLLILHSTNPPLNCPPG